MHVSIGSAGEVARLSLAFHIYSQSALADPLDIAKRLRVLLADPGSPIIPAEPVYDRSPTSARRQVAEFRRRVYSRDRAARRSLIPVRHGAPASLSVLTAALAGSSDHEIRLCLAAPPPRLSDEELDRVLTFDRAVSGASSLGAGLREAGRPVSAQLFVSTTSSRAVDDLVRSEMLRLLPEFEFVPLDSADKVIAVAVMDGLAAPTAMGESADELDVVMGTRIASSMFPLPLATSATFPGFDVEPTAMVRADLSVVETSRRGTLRLGRGSDPSGAPFDVNMLISDFSRHIFLPGQTGAGKSTALRALACELARQDLGFLMLDPHGETARLLLGELPSHRQDSVIFIDAADIGHPAPINPFNVKDPLQRDTALANMVAMFFDLFDPRQMGIIGPRWETWFRMSMLTLLEAHGKRASFLDVPLPFFDPDYLRNVKARVKDENVLNFWDREMAETQPFHKSEMLGYFTSKFTAFRTNAVLRAALSSGHDALDAAEVMDNGRIVIVSLDKGSIGGPISQLLGYVYLTRYWTAALRRTNAQRPFGLIIDEAHTFARGPLPDVLAEGRKFGLSAVIASQYLGQLSPEIQAAILGNVGTVAAFRLGEHDAQTLRGRFAPEFQEAALRRLPNFSAACSLLVDGAPAPAFSLDLDHYQRIAAMPNRTREAQAKKIRRQSAIELSRHAPKLDRRAQA